MERWNSLTTLFRKRKMKYSLKGQQHAQIKDWWQRPYAKQPNRLSFHFPVGTWGASSASLTVLSTSAATGAAMMGSSSLLPERSGWSKLVSSLSALILWVLEYVITRYDTTRCKCSYLWRKEDSGNWDWLLGSFKRYLQKTFCYLLRWMLHSTPTPHAHVKIQNCPQIRA